VASLDLNVLKPLPSLANVNWAAIEVWAAFGRAVNDGKDQECRGFREHACRTILRSRQRGSAHFPSDLREEDISRKNLKTALQMARTLGIDLPAQDQMDRAQLWAVSILHPKTQFSEDIFRTLLDQDLGGCIGILVAIRAEDRGAKIADGKFVHRLLHHQALITPNAKIL
jgi:hypothetical protein